MSSSAVVVDVEALLSPVAGDNPAGENLKYSGLFDEIREARRTEDGDAQGEWKRDLKAADFRHVRALCEGALASRSKDLQIAAWLCEALARTDGFIGLRDGLGILEGLLARYWDKVYPEMDEGDLEARANSFAWMDRQLALAVKEIPITKPSGASGALPFPYLKLEDARRKQSQKETSDEGRAAEEEFKKSEAATRRAFYEETWKGLTEAWERFQALDGAMDEKFGNQTPGLGALKAALQNVRETLEKTLKEKRALEPDAATDGAEGDALAASAALTGGQPAPSGPIQSRREALNRLAEVAEFFRRTEPHSPIPYLVQRAITWGQMPLEDWLRDVIKDGAALDQLKETLGIKPAVEESTSG